MSIPKTRPEVGQIFTNGAFCAPLQHTDPRTGKMEWVWIVTSFEDDSYKDGEYVDPNNYADSREELLMPYEYD